MTSTLRYSINVTLDGCCHHEAGPPPDAESMRYWTEGVAAADALLYGRVTYEMMESAWRRPEAGQWPDWMDDSDVAFSEAIDPAKKYVASRTLRSVDWNAQLLEGDAVAAVEQLKRETSGLILVGGVKLPLALADAGLIDEYEFVVNPMIAGHGPRLLDGLRERIALEVIERQSFSSGATVLKLVPSRTT